jgi:hypothetical protein
MFITDFSEARVEECNVTNQGDDESRPPEIKQTVRLKA